MEGLVDCRSNGETIWTAIRTQLIDRYTLYPTADGQGIYVVFWFGQPGIPPSPSGRKPASAEELEEELRAQLSPSEGRISVVVINCAWPAARKVKKSSRAGATRKQVKKRDILSRGKRSKQT